MRVHRRGALAALRARSSEAGAESAATRRELVVDVLSDGEARTTMRLKPLGSSAPGRSIRVGGVSKRPPSVDEVLARHPIPVAVFAHELDHRSGLRRLRA